MWQLIISTGSDFGQSSELVVKKNQTVLSKAPSVLLFLKVNGDLPKWSVVIQNRIPLRPALSHTLWHFIEYARLP